MRVTQSMLAVNTLRHITQGYDRLGKIQDQLASGKKITRASQDPVVAMNGMRYRSQVVEVDQFKRNLGEVYNWMDNADSTLDKTTQALHRVRELAVQASNDTYEEKQRANMAKEIDQLLDHVIGMSNTKSNGKFIFNGTNTTAEPVNRDKMDLGYGKITEYFGAGNVNELEVAYAGDVYKVDTADGTNITFVSKNNANKKITINNYSNNATRSIEFEYPNPDPNIATPVTEALKDRDLVISDRTAVSTNGQNVNIELLKGVNINSNINPQNVYSNALFGDIVRLKNLLEDPTAKSEDITKAMDVFDKHIDNIVSERAELGARVNRVEMIESRLMEQEVIAKRIMSNNEDADMEKVIIDLTTQESVHRAALSAGARIMQPTLMDFLR